MCMQARVIRVPVHIHEQMARLAQEDSDFRSRHGYAPSQLQLAGLMGITLERLQTMVKVSPAPAQRRHCALRCCGDVCGLTSFLSCLQCRSCSVCALFQPIPLHSYSHVRMHGHVRPRLLYMSAP